MLLSKVNNDCPKTGKTFTFGSKKEFFADIVSYIVQ
jgi:hypothetical protein